MFIYCVHDLNKNLSRLSLGYFCCRAKRNGTKQKLTSKCFLFSAPKLIRFSFHFWLQKPKIFQNHPVENKQQNDRKRANLRPPFSAHRSFIDDLEKTNTIQFKGLSEITRKSCQIILNTKQLNDKKGTSFFFFWHRSKTNKQKKYKNSHVFFLHSFYLQTSSRQEVVDFFLWMLNTLTLSLCR